MRILNAKQIRDLDAYTIEHEPVSSIDLMERASRAFVDWFTLRIVPSQNIGVVCGTGNNGGDGLAIARMLDEWGYLVKVWIIRGGAPESADFKINEARLPGRVGKYDVREALTEEALMGCDVLVDAIFGSGLSRPPSGLYAQVIDQINKTNTVRIAVDIPSGLMADAHSVPPIVRANHTVSFQLPKLAFLLPECYPFTGEWELVDIGLDKAFIRAVTVDHYYSKLRDVQKILRPRSKFDHKGTYGHALIIAGSYGKMGAALLASRAALRAGTGLLTVHIPQCGYATVQTALPEAMVEVDDDTSIFTGTQGVSGYDVIGIGPGLGRDKQTAKALARTLENYGKPVVLDADALNILAGDRSMMNLIPPGSILTPHPKEFERLTGKWNNDFERLEMLKQLAASLKGVVILKGAHTSVATEKRQVFFNSTGNPGMATGGTGDALTGIITGLLAQKYLPAEAAVAGVFLHGLAGDLAASEYGMPSMIASDVIDNLPQAFLKVLGKNI